jgi:hypothetical protein
VNTGTPWIVGTANPAPIGAGRASGRGSGRARCRDDWHAGFGGAGRGNGSPEKAIPRPGSTLRSVTSAPDASGPPDLVFVPFVGGVSPAAVVRGPHLMSHSLCELSLLLADPAFDELDRDEPAVGRVGSVVVVVDPPGLGGDLSLEEAVELGAVQGSAWSIWSASGRDATVTPGHRWFDRAGVLSHGGGAPFSVARLLGAGCRGGWPRGRPRPRCRCSRRWRRWRGRQWRCR